MKNYRLFFFLTIFVFGSSVICCQEINTDKLDFSKSDIFILKETKQNDKVKNLQIIVNIKKISHLVNKIENIYGITIFFSSKSKDGFQTSGQQSFIPGEGDFEFENKSKLTELKLVENNYLFMEFDILKLNLKKIDEIICDLVLNSESKNEKPILIKPTEGFIYQKNE